MIITSFFIHVLVLGCVPDNKLCGTLYGLTALTMSDFAYPIMSKVQLVEIVFNCAIGLRFKFRKPVSFLSVSQLILTSLFSCFSFVNKISGFPKKN